MNSSPSVVSTAAVQPPRPAETSFLGMQRQFHEEIRRQIVERAASDASTMASMLDQIRAIKGASEQGAASERQMTDSMLNQIRDIEKALDRRAQLVENMSLTAECQSKSSERTAEDSTEPNLEVQAAKQEEATIPEQPRERAAIQKPARPHLVRAILLARRKTAGELAFRRPCESCATAP